MLAFLCHSHQSKRKVTGEMDLIRYRISRQKSRSEKSGFISRMRKSRWTALYPLTLIFENDNTARLAVGRPIVSAGRNVVKISMRFTSGSASFEASASERMR
jgi:hypothetical protein